MTNPENKVLKRDSILETELVLIHIDEKPSFYARVESINNDKKPGWWQVEFLFLTLPLQKTIWTIDDEQIRGADFTMSGTPIRIEKIKLPHEEPQLESPPFAPASTHGNKERKKANVFSLKSKK